MPELKTLERAKADEREGKSPSTQAGEFVREEMHHIREGKHGAGSSKQAIAIGLSKARRAGVKLRKPTGSEARKKAQQDTAASKSPRRKVSTKRSNATLNALKKEPRSAASHKALSRQAKQSAAARGRRSRQQSASKAARTRSAA